MRSQRIEGRPVAKEQCLLDDHRLDDGGRESRRGGGSQPRREFAGMPQAVRLDDRRETLGKRGGAARIDREPGQPRDRGGQGEVDVHAVVHVRARR